MKTCGGFKLSKENRGSVEILLILCCTVGVVAFMSMALSMTNLAFMYESASTSVLSFGDDVDMQRIDLRNKTSYLRLLKSRLSELDRKIGYAQDKMRIPESGKMSTREYNNLQRVINQHQAEIAQKESQLAEISAQSTASSEVLQKKQAELKDLQRRLNEVLEERNHGSRRLGELKSNAPETAGLEQEQEILTQQLNDESRLIRELKPRIEKAREKAGSINPWDGTTAFKNPLIIECKANALYLHPSKEAIDSSTLETGNIFDSLSHVHDGVAFLVHPSGMTVFDIAFERASRTSLLLAQPEPVDEDSKIDYSRDGSR
jgi:flagellar biosynthesis chaperone FliJ